ncbi:MAG: N-acetylmuramoyl-L-alanine amidase [Hyphomicrobiaceae bacterium]
MLACAVAAFSAMISTPPRAQAQEVAGQQVAANVPSAALAGANAAQATEAVAKGPVYTRFIVGLERKVEFKVFALSHPNRVVLELADDKVRLPDLGRDGAHGLVKSFRAGLAAPGRMRIVIDVAQPVVVDSTKLDKTKGGYRLALDILSVDAAMKSRKGMQFAPNGSSTVSLQPPLPRPARSPKERAARAFKPVIVLDPGHGGMDSGATKYGTVEKDVVLAFAHVLREDLEATGRYKVLMTRSTDVFIPLDERRLYAERNGANLFIAIHADYANKRARGATIFSLRDKVAVSLKQSLTSRSAEKLLSPTEMDVVKQGNGDTATVANILADLAERDVARTQQRSDLFAKTVIENMSESTTMRDEPDQQAAFRVLKTAQFPSVLIELAYVTNTQDARNLKSDEWREKVADSIVQAIDNYFSTEVARLPM